MLNKEECTVDDCILFGEPDNRRFVRSVIAKNAGGKIVVLATNKHVGDKKVRGHCSPQTLASVTELYFKTPGNGFSEEQKKALKGFHITIAKAK